MTTIVLVALGAFLLGVFAGGWASLHSLGRTVEQLIALADTQQLQRAQPWLPYWLRDPVKAELRKRGTTP